MSCSTALSSKLFFSKKNSESVILKNLYLHALSLITSTPPQYDQFSTIPPFSGLLMFLFIKPTQHGYAALYHLSYTSWHTHSSEHLQVRVTQRVERRGAPHLSFIELTSHLYPYVRIQQRTIPTPPLSPFDSQAFLQATTSISSLLPFVYPSLSIHPNH